jgi:hypothetical protein
MLRIDLALADARDRQAAFRRPARPFRQHARTRGARRLLGAWIVRLGRVVTGHPATTTRLA